MLTQLKQFYYFYETEVINVKINDTSDDTQKAEID
jgi:hypothetical protein